MEPGKGVRQRLATHWREIEREMELLIEENAELRRRLAVYESTAGSASPLPTPLASPAPPVTPVNNKPLKTLLSRSTEKDKTGSITARDNKRQNYHDSGPLQKSDVWVSTKVLTGHRDGVWEVSACPWSLKRLGSASADRTARVWSLSGKAVSDVIYVGHSGSVNSIRFHPRERLVCTASGDRTCHLWKVPSSRKELAGHLHESPVDCAPRNNPLWSPLLRRASGDVDRSLLPEDLDAEATPTRGSGPAVDFLEGEASGSVAEVLISSCQIPLLGHTGPVVAADFLTEGNSVASVSLDNSIAFWDVEQGHAIHTIPNVHDNGSSFTNLTTDGKNMALTASTDGIVRLWDARNAHMPIASTVAHEASANSAMYLSRTDPYMILSAGDDRACRTWDIRNMKQPQHTIRGSAPINRFSISPLTGTIALPMDDRRTRLCDLPGNRLGNIRSHVKGGHSAIITGTAWSNDESVVYTCSFSRESSIVAWTKDIAASKASKRNELK